MANFKIIELTAQQRAELEQGYRNGENHAFRSRCQIILLKSEKRSSLEVAAIVGCCEMVVNNWLRRYQDEGFYGLHTKPGRGRKAILDAATDLEQIRAAVRGNRQRISLAKADLEETLGKRFSDKTLTRFLKNTLLAINESESVPARSQNRTSTN
jgi:transposase